MAKLSIVLPEKMEFSTSIKIRITDINYGGHLGNDTLLSLLHEARVRFLASKDCKELNCFGSGLIMNSVQIDYKSEAFYADILDVQVGIIEITKTGFELGYRFVSRTTGLEVAKALNGMVFFNFEKRRVVRTPERFREAFKLEEV